jgi:hypothetical protein
MVHLRFPIINLYVPVLTPQLHRSEDSLQFSEKPEFLFLCRINTYIACPRTEQNKLQVLKEHRLYTDCTILGNGGTSLQCIVPLFIPAVAM